jgi:predicted  nucleic acid-binding Zn-ribbon protein
MLKELKPILEIQELDMQMIQLMRLKNDRKRERTRIQTVKENLERQTQTKESEIIELKKTIRIHEGEVNDIQERVKKLELQQNQVKKVDEFNALSQEISQSERERNNKEQRLSEMFDRLAQEEDLLKDIQGKLKEIGETNTSLEAEIDDSIDKINVEGKSIFEQRQDLVRDVDPSTFGIYERLLKNKKDRVVVPVENRCCSGCHITITAQDENLVRRGERVIFCEHCSRIQYWPESTELEGDAVQSKPRRRRRTTTKS